ncbi:metal ABC transporter substrate-binding protein [Conexibacter arvalis]|uniref:ABC-type Zn uptake system ZnuABC Zn-binding protein ZnuA n=1 Tax=Conexibacter arvalis TaxID=912552 RepID=A0A840IFJ2_9ACTN|nr:metal ABC transporter substrate-binding protein [Conexibacter arvalis]MBB4662758.1 ABC-type Zn uptake system ZnuABC Zn-binding protein ZnuA [Conexibacter arvalis]
MPISSRPRALLAAGLSTAVIALAGCGSDDGGGVTTGTGGSDAGSVDVVATTTVLGDIARAVGGDAVRVDQLLQPNSDPHDYEPRPGDVVATSKAALVLASGDGLDDWIEEVVAQSAGDPTVLDLASELPVRRDSDDDDHDHADDDHAGEEAHAEDGHGHDHADDAHAGEDDHGHDHAGEEAHAEDEHGHAGEAHADEESHADDDGHDHGPTDPHWWHDPTNVEAAANAVRDALTAANPGGRAVYAANAAAYVSKVRALDAGIRRCLAAVPERQRKLVTDHDALGYFADRYDVEVVGAVIPSLSTQAQPSAGDVAELARVIRREGVRAVFPESGSSRKLPEALAKETGVTAAYHLYGDALGPEGSGADTYLGMEAANADAMVRGFTGGERGCEIAGL